MTTGLAAMFGLLVGCGDDTQPGRDGGGDVLQARDTGVSVDAEAARDAEWDASGPSKPGGPVLFYSDLTSGPNYGGEEDQGAFVTVWGRGFGGQQADGYVTVGGGRVGRYLSWRDDQIVFQLGPEVSSGQIVVVTASGSSNGLPFQVREGNIYFVAPDGNGDGSVDAPFSPSDYVARLESGEKGAIAYFRAGVYEGEFAYPNWHANFCLLAEHGGEPGRPNAFVAYPGERAVIRTGGSADRSNFRLHASGGDPTTAPEYVVVAKFHLFAQQGSVQAHTGWRVVGNHVTALQVPSATGAITTGLYQDGTARDIVILGNEIFGGRSGDKLDHAIYPGSGTSNLEIAWNVIHDNDFGAGPMISVNCNDAAGHDLVSENVRIHGNWIDVRAFPARAIGVFETAPGSTIFVYNNVILGGGPSGTPTVYAMSGDLFIANNTLVDCGSDNLGSCFSFYEGQASGPTYRPHVVVLQNNLIVAGQGASYYVRQNGAQVEGTAANLYFGIDTPRSDDLAQSDEDGVWARPLFRDQDDDDYHLAADSPGRDQGVDVDFVPTDRDGVPRPQGGAFDIGAYEAPH